MLILRGETYHMDTTCGGSRLRFSLGTRDGKSADRLSNRVKFALSDGPNSVVWPQLQKSLPKSSFKILTSGLNLASNTDLTAFQKMWEEHLDRRVRLGEITESSAKLYRGMSRIFFDWLYAQKIQLMDDITGSVVEKYVVQRKEHLKAKGRGGRGIITEQTILSAIFDLAVREGVIKSNPVKYRFKPDTDPVNSAPFTSEEMDRLDSAAGGTTRLAFMVFKHTGLRGSDVASITWSSINWTEKTITWRTKKRGVTVTIPIAKELFDVLVYKELGSPPPKLTDQIIPNVTRESLYALIRKLGEKSGVKNCHPHRFRSTFCVTLLSKGATIFDVAKLIGDTVSTVEKNYAPNTAEMVERTREFMGGNHDTAGID